MTTSATRIALTVAVLTLTSTLVAQQGVPAARTVRGGVEQLRSLRPEEYRRWEQLVAQRTPLSPDGRWLVYGIRRGDYQTELRVQATSGGDAVTIVAGEQPSFSDDSRWMAYLIGFTEEQEAKLRKEKKPLRKQLGLLELATGNTTTVEGIESFALSPSGTHLAMRRYAPEAKDDNAAAPANSETVQPGTQLIVRELATGNDATFAAVSEMAWQDKGTRLAFAVTAENGVGNGVQLFDTATGTLRVLDSSTSSYSGLSWRKNSAALAALRSSADSSREGPNHALLVWPDVIANTTARELDAAKSGLAADLRVVRFRAPQWSEDGAYLFVGVAPWHAKPAALDADRQSRRIAAGSENPEELPDVQVWHPKDPIVMPRQKIDARRDRERSMLAAWSLGDGRFIRIAQAIGEETTPIKRSGRALVVDTNAFAMERSMGRIYANVATVDLLSGARTDIAQRVEDRALQSSPNGRYLLYLKNDHYWTVDLASGRQTNVTANVAASFVDRESDDTGPHKPPFGVAGWTAGDATVLLYDKLDIWEVKPDGTGAVKLTNGKDGEIRHRYIRLDPDEEWIDRAQPLLVSQFGLRSKKSGYARIAPGATAVTPLLFLDKRVTALAKAKSADRFVYAVQDFDDSPDYFASGPTLTDAKQVTSTNPFMRDYAWGRSTLIEYKSKQGLPLQGAVFYPAGYDPSKKYPMVVYMYEKLSDGVHQFSMPSERDVYNAAAFTTRGYVYLQPDIVFRPRDPGLSVVDSVVPAVQRVIDMGIADPAKIGIVGHSWGGFDTVFLATHTNVFKAAVAGAPITDLVSNYGNHHWSSGIAETDHIETGQQRMQVPLYEDLQAYIRNSALYAAHTMQTPLLMMFGENDGTVHWHQGVALYNVARRAGKNVVMLAYAGEDHGLRKRQNQIDYHHRIFEWFDHYLTGAEAPRWITHGERYLERERDLQRRKVPAKPVTTTSPQ
jgi:dipeptidyl aminopeptidase/acylaminoacyl peptidase